MNENSHESKCQSSPDSVTSFLTVRRKRAFTALIHPLLDVSLLLFQSAVAGKGTCSLLLTALDHYTSVLDEIESNTRTEAFGKREWHSLYYFIFCFIQ